MTFQQAAFSFEAGYELSPKFKLVKNVGIKKIEKRINMNEENAPPTS